MSEKIPHLFILATSLTKNRLKDRPKSALYYVI